MTPSPSREPARTDPDFEAALSQLTTHGMKGTVAAAAAIGCALPKAMPDADFEQKYYLGVLFNRAADATSATGDLAPLMAKIRDLASGLGRRDFVSFVNSAFYSPRGDCPLLSNAANHDFAGNLLSTAVVYAVMDRQLGSIDQALGAIVKFNCSIPADSVLVSPPSFVPDTLRKQTFLKDLERAKGDGIVALRELLASPSIGEFLVQRMQRARSIEDWVGKERVAGVFSALCSMLSDTQLRRYRCATSGLAGEAELFEAIIAREEWILPSDGSNPEVYSDIGSTLFFFDVTSQEHEAFLGRIERLKAVEASGIRVTVCTDGNPDNYADRLHDLGLRAYVGRKREFSNRHVHVLIDDSTPESQESIPLPSLYLKALPPPKCA